jgi:hypothetical protein
MKLVPDEWRWPRLFTHLFDHPSTTITLGLWLFLVASWGSFFAATDRKLTPDMWLWCVILSGILVGGVKVTKSLLEAMELKLGGAKPEDVRKEATANAPATPNP